MRSTTTPDYKQNRLSYRSGSYVRECECMCVYVREPREFAMVQVHNFQMLISVHLIQPTTNVLVQVEMSMRAGFSRSSLLLLLLWEVFCECVLCLEGERQRRFCGPQTSSPFLYTYKYINKHTHSHTSIAKRYWFEFKEMAQQASSYH